MDLSQQELPLTAYFTRGKETRLRAVPKDRPPEDSRSVACPSKRRRSLQLPTPAPSARKRMRSERLEELPRRTQLSSTSVSVEQNAILSSQRNVAELKFEPTPSKLPQLSRKGAEDAGPEVSSTLAPPSTDRRKSAKPIDIEFCSGRRHSDHAETGIATPQTSRRTSEPVHGIDDHFPLARSSCRLPSKPSQVSSRLPDQVPRAVLSYTQLSSLSTTGLSCSPIGLGSRKGASTPLKQYFVQSETLGGQPSDGHVIPMIPVPSSQSQYLLHPDATPKRKRCYRRTGHVISSQTQEEAELTLPTPDKPATMVNLSLSVSPGKHTPHGNTRSPRLSRSERKNQRIYTLDSTFVGLPINSPVGPSCSLSATKNGSGEPSSKSSSPSRCMRLASYHSPSCSIKTPRRSTPHNSVENISPSHIEDSLTESESESEMLRVRTKDKLSTLDLLSREMNQIPRHPPVHRNACPPTRGSTRGNLPSIGDDSATEAESDTEILRCVAEIGKKRRSDHRLDVSREDTPPLPVISPLVSPARSRIAAIPSIIGFTQFPRQEGIRPSVPGSGASYLSTTEQSQTRSESLPSVVRDFIRMFPGDESYPADFPESLRI